MRKSEREASWVIYQVVNKGVVGGPNAVCGQAGAIDHVTIGDRAVVGAQTAVLRSVPADGRVLGYPARPAWAAKRVWVALGRLPELRRALTAVMKHLGLRDSSPRPVSPAAPAGEARPPG